MFISINPIKTYSHNIKSSMNIGADKYPNLSPLKNDVVSFSGRAKLMAENMSNAPRCRDCSNVSYNAEPTKLYLEKLLDKYLKKFVKKDEKDKSKNKPILTYYVRVKSPNSIREKVVSKYTKIISTDAQDFCTEVIDNLLKYFSIENGMSREDIIDECKNLFSNKQVQFTPYNNVVLSFNSIVEQLSGMKAMSFQPEDKFLQVCNVIRDNLRSKYNSRKYMVYINPQSKAGIKYYANDVVGARIVMADSRPNDTVIILNALKKAVENKEIKITSVESNLPDPDKLPPGKSVSDYEYATRSSLIKFADDTNSTFEENKSKTGYLAIHINVEFTDPTLRFYKDQYKGYSGEIQIIGRDVLQLKEVEDLCYKIKDNKNAVSSAYEPFVEYFKKYYKDDDVKSAFDDYTYALYLAQRAVGSEKRKDNSFPSIEELGFKGRVPDELDFNKLKKLKEYCDMSY